MTWIWIDVGPEQRLREQQPQISPLRSPGFPVETCGVDCLPAALFKESRKRGRRRQRDAGNPGTLRSR
jgi:hypothetical protein